MLFMNNYTYIYIRIINYISIKTFSKHTINIQLYKNNELHSNIKLKTLLLFQITVVIK